MHTGETWRLGRRPALDGLRGVAVLLVVAYHIGAPMPAGGIVGVTLFFVLSGFLITALLLEEDARESGISLRAFYGRRARRLVPALVVMLSFTGGFAVLTRQASVSDVLAAGLYGANWWQATGHHLGTMLVQTWTLAAEEQFYLLWPLALLVLRRSPRALAITGGAAVAVMAGRMLWASAGASSTLILYTSGEALLAGCALAIWMHRRPTTMSPAPIIPALVALVVAMCWTPLHDVVQVAGVMAAATGTAVLIVGVLVRQESVPTLDWAPLRAVGRRSYGVYLWHLPILTAGWVLGTAAGLGHWSQVAVSLAATCVVVELSWRFVEQRAKVQGCASTFITAGPAAPPAYVSASVPADVDCAHL